MTNCHNNLYVDGLKRRRAAARRLAILDCGCSDPWGHDHELLLDEKKVSDVELDAYRDTALMLLSVGLTPAPNLPAMRMLWRRGGADRDLVSQISSRWEVAA
jgi:hypothetical protein